LLKVLRGTIFDPLGGSHDRRLERALLRQYEQLFARFAAELDPSRYDLAVKIARLPQSIKGFGPVKTASAQAAEAELGPLLAAWDADGVEEGADPSA
jgi:indolepyruvate ferredoxin oxidoreductase